MVYDTGKWQILGLLSAPNNVTAHNQYSVCSNEFTVHINYTENNNVNTN